MTSLLIMGITRVFSGTGRVKPNTAVPDVAFGIHEFHQGRVIELTPVYF